MAESHGSELEIGLYGVGLPYSKDQTTWEERTDYHYCNGEHRFIVFAHDLSVHEIKAFRRGEMCIGLYVQQPLIYFLYRIEGLFDFSEQSFSIRLISPACRKIPEYRPNERILLTMILVNADTGIIEAIRSVTYSPQFTQHFVQAMREQLTHPYERATYDRLLAQNLIRFPRVADMVKVAQIREVAGMKGTSAPAAPKQAVAPNTNLPRPLALLQQLTRDYPIAPKLAESLRLKFAGEWPAWCFLPRSAIAQIFRQFPEDPLKTPNPAAAQALLVWRFSQGIYRYDPTLYAAVRNTSITGDLPSELLYRMPENAIYVETPDMTWLGERLYGFFALLDCEPSPSLNIVLDLEQQPAGLTLKLGRFDLAHSLGLAIEEIKAVLIQQGMDTPTGQISLQALSSDELHRQLAGEIEPLVALLLYLCSVNAEIGRGGQRPEPPKPKKTRKGLRLFPPEKPRKWDVGVRIGAALRQAYHEAETQRPAAAGQAGGWEVRPHIRRAHWHSYWTGPRSAPDQRQIQAKWLPPIPVKLAGYEDLPATIHPIKPPEQPAEDQSAR